MHRPFRVRIRIAAALLAASLPAASSGQSLDLVDHRLHPRLQKAYGNVLRSLLELEKLLRELPAAGKNCRPGPSVQCVDGGVMINKVELPPQDAARARRGAAAYLATTGSVGDLVCKKATYCPEDGAPKFKVEGCIRAACPIEPDRNRGGCVVDECSGTLVTD